MARAAPAQTPADRNLSLVDTMLRIGLLALLICACAWISLPFIGILTWSVVLAVLLYPLHLRLAARIGNRWSALAIGIVGIALLLVPTIIVATSLAGSVQALLSGLRDHTLTVPPPPPRLAELPLVGQKLSDAWAAVSNDAPAAIKKYGPTIRTFVAWLASVAGKLAAGELSFLLSFGIAAVLVAYGTSIANFAKRLLGILTGSAERGARLVAMTAATIRGVLIGVVGVAVIQSVLLWIGFFIMGVPAAGLLTIVILLLGIVQVPATLLTLPIIAYVFATSPTGPAAIFAVWTLVAGLSDNVLKPLMLGRGMEVPMPVILVGVIGGMIADGLIGLFVGPVILAVGYVLFLEWLREHPLEEAPQVEGPAP